MEKIEISEPEFAEERPEQNPKSVKGISKYSCDGPYSPKSGSKLYVSHSIPLHSSYSLPEGTDEWMFNLDEIEEEKLVNHVKTELFSKGLSSFDFSMVADRAYFHENMREGSTGGKEFHRIRKELFFVRKGQLELELEDVYRNKKQFTLKKKQGVIIPPFMLHTYKVKQNNSILDVRANTGFFFNHPDFKNTRICVPDTYPIKTFRELQKQF